MHVANTDMFIVGIDYMIRVDSNLVSYNIGTILGSGRVTFAHNQITGGYELVINTGATGYIYNSVTDTLSAITDPDFPGSYVTDYVDSYVLGVAPDGTYWFHSDLANAGVYLTTDRYEAESDPDLIVTLIVDHREVWVMNQRTIEIFQNTGATGATFERASGTIIERGCAGKYTPARMDNTIYWLGNDGIVYKADGYSPVRISNASIEQDIEDLDWTQAYSQVYESRGHKIYYLTFPDGKTWGYDASTGQWHRRETFLRDNWAMTALAYFNGLHFVGRDDGVGINTLEWDYFYDGEDPLISTRRTQYMHDNQNKMILNCLECVFDTGNGLTTGLGSDPQVMMRYSDDGGHVWSNTRYRDLGLTGKYRTRVKFNRLGQFICRAFEVSVSDPVKRDLIAASVTANGN